MKADYQSFKRAVSVCLLGLALQLAMGLALLLYGVVGNDHAAVSAALFALLGVIVWLALAVVFDQHRRERVEALEAEAIAAQGARAASVFGEGGDDLRVAARRLAGMHRILLPVLSLAFAAALVGIGVWRFQTGNVLTDEEKFSAELARRVVAGWPITIGFAVAVVGFLFARFVAGMAKQPVWANLRAGASMAVGAALVGLALAIGHSIDYRGPDTVARYMNIAIPIAMLVVAAEIVLNFLLGIYRPRRPGEIPRPAFDSRILGFAAAPDKLAESIGGALNYQFGFDVTGSWFYQLLSRSLTALLVVGVGVMWLLTSVAVVQPNEQGIRVRFGQNVTQGGSLGPGPYLKLPWPFERIERFDADTVRRVDLGGAAPKTTQAILWTNDHGVQERLFIVQPSAVEGSVGPADISLVSIEVPLFYVIEDFTKFNSLAAPDAREQRLRVEAQRELLRYLATRSVDDILGRGRAGAAAELQRRIGELFDKLEAGVKVTYVGIEGVHPPRETAEAYETVVSSQQKRESAVENGRREADESLILAAGSLEMARDIIQAMNRVERAAEDEKTALEAEVAELISKAGGSAAIALIEARADRWQMHMQARARAERHASEIALYDASPTVYVAQRYFDTLRRVMEGKRLYILGDDRIEVRINLEDTVIGGNLFQEPASAQPPAP